MSVDISPGSRCWLHPGERVIGVCATCLKERLGRLAFLPSNTHNVAPRFSFDASFLPRRDFPEPKVGIISTLIESDAENFEKRRVDVGRSTVSYLLRSKSLSLAKGSQKYSCSNLGANTDNAHHRASKEETKSLHLQSEIANAKPTNDGCISRERKSLRDLFFASDGSGYAFQSSISNGLENFSSNEVEKKHEHKQEMMVENLKLDALQGEGEGEGEGQGQGQVQGQGQGQAKAKDKEVSEVSQSIASLIKEDLHSRVTLGYHPVSKVSKHQITMQKQTEQKSLKLNGTVKDQASSFHSPSISQSTGSSLFSPTRSCMSEFPSVENNLNEGRSRSLSIAGGSKSALDLKNSNYKEIRDSTRFAPTMKQVNPLTQNGQDLKVNVSDTASEKSSDQKTISCLVALDLYERKQFSRSNSTRASVWIKSFAGPMQAIKSKQLKKDQFQLKHESISFEKAKGTRLQSMVDAGKKWVQSSPRSHSQDHSFMSFYLSPLRRSRRKWTEKLERHGRDTSNSSPSTVESNSPWSFYLTPLRSSRRNKVNR